ncbi:MAG: hypothetical protein J6Q14_07840, partial [Oscillospiraceae bacterium]|nr:hypothetical protein [Oscillospiraceae bacterium]
KAKKWLAEHKLAITSLELSAADLSKLDRNIGSYHTGDMVPVVSKPHGVNDLFQLTDRTTDWLDPAGGSKVSLGKTRTSLVGLDVAGDRQSASNLDKVKQEITTNYKNGIANAVAETERVMSSLIDQAADSIILSVEGKYTSQSELEELRETLRSELSVLESAITMQVTAATERIEEVDGDLQTKFNTITKYFTFDINGMTIGAVDNPNKVVIDNDEICIMVNGVAVQKFDATGRAKIPELDITKALNLFGYLIEQDTSGNVNCEYMGG